MTCLEKIRQTKLYGKTSVDTKVVHNPNLLDEAATKLLMLRAILKAKQSENT
jgi:hypothetical protein